MKSLVIYSTVIGSFYINSDVYERAIAVARSKVGDEAWKRGYSGIEPKGPTAVGIAELKEASISFVKFEGTLKQVSFHENKDSVGNVYSKLYILIENNSPDNELLLSLDLKSDVAQKLIVKLDNCKLGDYIRINAWPVLVDKDGRQYINHAVSMKNKEGQEVPFNGVFSNKVKVIMEETENTLKAAGVEDKKVLNSAKQAKRVSLYKDFLIELEKKLNSQ